MANEMSKGLYVSKGDNIYWCVIIYNHIYFEQLHFLSPSPHQSKETKDKTLMASVMSNVLYVSIGDDDIHTDNGQPSELFISFIQWWLKQ